MINLHSLNSMYHSRKTRRFNHEKIWPQNQHRVPLFYILVILVRSTIELTYTKHKNLDQCTHILYTMKPIIGIIISNRKYWSRKKNTHTHQADQIIHSKQENYRLNLWDKMARAFAEQNKQQQKQKEKTSMINSKINSQSNSISISI